MNINTMDNSNNSNGATIPVANKIYNLPDGSYSGTIVVSYPWDDGKKKKWVLHIKLDKDKNKDEEDTIFCKSVPVPLCRDPQKKFYERGRDKYNLNIYEDYIGVRISFDIKNNMTFSNFANMRFRKNKKGELSREKI